MSSLPASDPGSAAVWGSKRINPRPQSCLRLTWSGYTSSNDDDDDYLRLLERFHQRCLRIIFNIHWSDYVSNFVVLEQAEITSIEAILLKSQLRWAGHVSRMHDHRLPKIALYGKLSIGHRNRWAPMKGYKDSLKKSLGACHIYHRQWSTLAADRVTWRHIIHQAVSSFEDFRKNNQREKRRKRKNREASRTTIPGVTFDCSCCGRTCYLALVLSATSVPAVDVDHLHHEIFVRKAKPRRLEMSAKKTS